MANSNLYLKIAVLVGLLIVLPAACQLIKLSLPTSDTHHGDDAAITFLGLAGEADCMVISHRGQHIMIDSGEISDKNYILGFLRKNQIKQLHSLILTHPDKDHIGGAAAVISAVPVGQIIQSNLQKDSKLQNSLNAAMASRDITAVVPRETMTLKCGEVTLTILPPLVSAYQKDNNYSLVVLANYGQTNILLAGDAEKKRIEEIINLEWPAIDIYKVAHHGRANKLSAPLIAKINPQTAVITAAQGEQEVINALQKCSAEIYYTPRGDVTFTFNPEGYRKSE